MTRQTSGHQPARDLPPEYDRASAGQARLRQRALGAGLRQALSGVVDEPIPDDFRAILSRADQRRAGH